MCLSCGIKLEEHETLLSHTVKTHMTKDLVLAVPKDMVRTVPKDLVSAVSNHLVPAVPTITKSPVAFECKLCDKKFPLRRALELHLRGHNAKFGCTICTEVFGTTFQLKLHEKVLHKDGRQFRCEHCGKTFDQRQRLRDHLVTHTGDRPYQCPICQKTFSVKSNCRRHMTVHNIKVPKPPSSEHAESVDFKSVETRMEALHSTGQQSPDGSRLQAKIAAQNVANNMNPPPPPPVANPEKTPQFGIVPRNPSPVSLQERNASQLVAQIRKSAAPRTQAQAMVTHEVTLAKSQGSSSPAQSLPKPPPQEKSASPTPQLSNAEKYRVQYGIKKTPISAPQTVTQERAPSSQLVVQIRGNSPAQSMTLASMQERVAAKKPPPPAHDSYTSLVTQGRIPAHIIVKKFTPGPPKPPGNPQEKTPPTTEIIAPTRSPNQKNLAKFPDPINRMPNKVKIVNQIVLPQSTTIQLEEPTKIAPPRPISVLPNLEELQRMRVQKQQEQKELKEQKDLNKQEQRLTIKGLAVVKKGEEVDKD